MKQYEKLVQTMDLSALKGHGFSRATSETNGELGFSP
jgi:hypothetical protein